jgi:hypothetical protein
MRIITFPLPPFQPTPHKLHELQISQRPRKTWFQTLNALLFIILFNIGCLMINGFQFTILLPLRLLPLPQAKKLYDEGIRYSKGAFGTLLGKCQLSLACQNSVVIAVLLVLVTQLFGPTTMVISFEKEGPGRFTPDELERVVVRDKTGKVIALNLPQKAVLIANHQVRRF